MHNTIKAKKETAWERKQRLKTFRKQRESERKNVLKDKPSLVYIDYPLKPTLDDVIGKDKVKSAVWKSLDCEEKVKALGYYIKNYANFKAFSVHMSLEFIEAMKASYNWADFIRRRLNANLKKKFGFTPDLMFVIEGGVTEPYHLHGVINVANISEETVRDIFKASLFGSDYMKSPFNKYIWKSRELKSSLGWAYYCLKDFKGDSSRLYMTNDLRRFVRESIEASIKYESFDNKQLYKETKE